MNSHLCLLAVAASAVITQAEIINKSPEKANDIDWYHSAAKTVEEIVRKHESFPESVTKALGPARAFPEVSTSSGTLIGRTMDESHAFYSVRYGRVPNRYMPPVPETIDGAAVVNVSNPDVLQCFQGPADCTEDMVCNKNMNEDCLVLNVHVPSSVDMSDPTSSKLPVMFWIHGGAFFFGAGTIPLYDGRWLSNTTNAVMVSVNYRLDALGFLVLEEGDKFKFEGNQGLKDQQLALRWVQDNIESFGGDKDQVTIFGNSAGAQSVMMHLLSDVSKPMFKRALMQSNPAVFYYYTPQEALWVTEQLLQQLACNETLTDAECLLQTPPDQIVNVRASIMAAALRAGDIYGMIEPYRPVVDGVEFTDQPLNLFRDGKWQSDKEVLLGTQTDELGYIDALFDGRKLPCTVFRALNIALLGRHYGPLIADEYMALDGLTPTSNCAPTAADEIGDMIFDCPVRALSRFMSETSAFPFPFPSPIYLYANQHGLDGDQCYKVEALDGLCGLSVHGLENVFVFGTGPQVGWNYTKDDEIVVKMFSDYWGAFAYTGHPSPQADIWPPYVAQTQGTVAGWSNVRIKAPSSEVESGYRQDYCDFWDSIGFYVNFTSPSTAEPDVTTTGAHDETTTGSDANSVETTTSDSFPVETTTKSVQETVETTSSSDVRHATLHVILLTFFVGIANLLR